MMNLQYRKATIYDVDIIFELADRIWRNHYTSIISIEQIEYMLNKMYSSQSLIKQMNDGHNFILVYDSEIPIGYISFSSCDDKNYFLHKFYVDSSIQNKGIGSLLFNYVLRSIENAKTIELTVNRQNFKAINFYFKHGFKIKSVEDFDIGNGYFMNDFVMQKVIK